MRLATCIRLVQLVAVGLDLGGEAGWPVEHCAAPEWALRECAQVEARDDAEVVAAAAEGAEEVGVGGGVCGDEGAGGEDEFVVEDGVADEAFAGREE